MPTDQPEPYVNDGVKRGRFFDWIKAQHNLGLTQRELAATLGFNYIDLVGKDADMGKLRLVEMLGGPHGKTLLKAYCIQHGRKVKL